MNNELLLRTPTSIQGPIGFCFHDNNNRMWKRPKTEAVKKFCCRLTINFMLFIVSSCHH